MRIGVDGRGLRGGRGVARYTSRLLRELAGAHPDDEWRVFLARGEDVEMPHRDLVVRRDPRPQRALFGAAAVTGRPHLDALLGGELDVVWAPAPAPLALGARVPLVLTVHDLAWEERPGDFSAYERAWHRLARPRALAARASVVVCDSAATRDAIAQRWPEIEQRRVRVVRPGVDRATQPPRMFHRLPGRYFLAVGALEPRKGIDVLLRAFARARAHGLDADLVLAGSGPLGGGVAGPGVHVLGPVSDDELAACYAQALALVMPSWLEGFGLPPLEALAHGTPAIVSDLPVFEETLGREGALRVPPGNAEALAHALVALAGDPQLRHALVGAGTRAIAPLTWASAAEGVYAALEQAVARA